MVKQKRKKKHWTTKNSHFKRMKKKDDKNSPERVPLLWAIMIVVSIICMFIAWAFDTNRSGYDHFIGIPKEWIKWVK